MMNHRKTSIRLAVIAIAVGGLANLAGAQTAAPPPGAPPQAPPPTAPTDSPTGIPKDVLPDVPAGEAAPTESEDSPPPSGEGAASNLSAPPRPKHAAQQADQTPPAAPVFPAGVAAPPRHRVKPLTTTMGLDPTAPDFGAETDLVSSANEGSANVKPKRWTFVAHGYLRAPMRVGIGPTSGVTNGMTSSNQAHSPAHVVGARNDDWNSVGLYPSPLGSLYLSVGNAVVSGTLIITSGTFADAGYKQLSESGGINQGYLTMKFNDAFGDRGGLAVTAGAFSNRYGLAGPDHQSSGYYNTYLYGRTRVAGVAMTADLDLTDHAELILEAGGGSKLEVVPWLAKPVATPYLPDQGPTPQGSNFVYHGHAALEIDDWLQLAGHFMASWSPNDLQASTAGVGNAQSAHMYTYGAEAHLDLPRFGNAYFGYSRVSAVRAIALADGIEVIHSPNGTGLTRNYLNPAFQYMYPPLGSTVNPIIAGTVGDEGDIDTLLFQYMGRVGALMDLPATGRDVTFALFGMYNHVSAPMLAGGKQDKFKAGGEVSAAVLRYLSLGVRFDRVMPNGGNADVAYSALSPRLIFHSTWVSREYVLLSYTRYFLGSNPQIVASQYDPVKYVPDPNLLVLSALISF